MFTENIAKNYYKFLYRCFSYNFIICLSKKINFVQLFLAEVLGSFSDSETKRGNFVCIK